MAYPAGTNKMGNNGGRFYDFLNKPVLIDCNFVVDSANGNGLGIRSLKGAGVQNVFMHTSSTPARGANGILNPNPAAGFALIQLANNYNRYAGGFAGFASPLSGSNLAINASALTPGQPYVITSIGAGAAGAQTIAPTADTAGSLASKYFQIYDSYGNTYVVWFSVAGVGSAPVGVSGTLVQQSIASGATAAQVGAALVVTLNGLLAAQPGNITAPSGVNSFSAAGTTTVTVTNTASRPFPGGAMDGAGSLATAFTFAVTKSKTNNQNWANVGLPAGVVPALGASFVATAAGDASGGSSSGLVKVPGVSGSFHVEVVGDPSQSLAPIPSGGSPNVGGWLLVQFLTPTVSTGAYVSPMAATAPADETVVGMSFVVEAGSILIAGE